MRIQPATKNPLLTDFIGTVRDAGLTNPYGLAAVAATGQAESGFSPSNVYRTWSDPSQSGQAGTAGGVMSWRNERLKKMQRFAADRGDDPNRPSVQTQAQFFASEDPALFKRLQGAKSVEEAQRLMDGAWRFAGYDQPGGEAERRLQTARQFANGIGSDAAASASPVPETEAPPSPSLLTAYADAGSTPSGTATDTPMEERTGGLGGLGGFLKSDGFGDMLRAVGMSLMTDDGSGNPLAKVPAFLSQLQQQRETTSERELARQEKLNDRQATQAVLQQAGLSADEAKSFSTNPTAAKLAMDLHRQEADRASYGNFVGRLTPPEPISPVSSADSPRPTAPTMRPPAGSSLLAPSSLSDTMPTRSPASVPDTAPPVANQTEDYRNRLAAENERLYGVAATARTDEERQAAAAAIKVNENRLAQVDKLLDRRNEAPPGYRRSANGNFEAVPGGPADPAVVAANRTQNAPADVQEYQFYVDQERAAGREPRSFIDYQTANRKAGATTITTGGGENKQVFDAVAESAAGARSAVSGLNSIREARAAIDGGGVFGAGADVRLGLQKLGAYLGITDPSAITNTETFRSAIAPSVAALMKQTVGSTNISNSDREFAEKAAGGSISLEPTTIKRLLDIMERASTDVVQSHRSRLDKVYPDGAGFDRERALFGVDAPTASPAPTGAPTPAGGATAGGLKWKVK